MVLNGLGQFGVPNKRFGIIRDAKYEVLGGLSAKHRVLGGLGYHWFLVVFNAN